MEKRFKESFALPIYPSQNFWHYPVLMNTSERYQHLKEI